MCKTARVDVFRGKITKSNNHVKQVPLVKDLTEKYIQAQRLSNFTEQCTNVQTPNKTDFHKTSTCRMLIH